MQISFFINAFGWSLIHSLWQAAIIFVALKLSLNIFRQAPSRVKYLMAYCALVGIFLCFLFTFYDLWDNQSAIQQVSLASTGGILSMESVKNFALVKEASGFNFFNSLMWVDYFVLLYCAGLIFFIGKAVRDFWVMQHIRHTRIKPFDKAWEHYLDKLRIAWRIPQQIKLFLSEYIDVPVVIGYMKPVIYLPFTAATLLTPEQIEAILLHELAHIKRNDFAANIFQTFIETILFFNPFVRMISKIIRRERENCCDDLVLSATQPRLYAETLLALAENQVYKGDFVLAAAGEKQQLFQRIKRIMEMKTKKLNIMQKLLVLLILAVGIVSVSWLIPGKKTDPGREIKAAVVNAVSPLISKAKADTMIAPPPPSAPQVAARPSVPVNPASPEPPAPPPPPAVLPAPPIAVMASADTFPDHFLNDSAFSNMRNQMHQYFSSDAWKKYQQDLQTYQQHLQKYFQSKEWKEYQEKMQQMGKQMGRMAMTMDSSAKWQSFRLALKAEANKMAALGSNREWRTGMDSLKEQLSRDRFHMDSLMAKDKIRFSFNRAKIDSLMTETRKKWALEGKNHPRMFLFSDRRTVNPNEIVAMMERDGLIRDENNFSIKINGRGLYINGKKQSQRYFEKYRPMVGDRTNLEIKKKGSNFRTSVHTDEKTSHPE